MVMDCDSVRIVMRMLPFEGEETTRTTVDGSRFETGDEIRFKIMCPHSASHENGETWGSYYTITAPSLTDEVSYWSSGTYGTYENQQTTYIYTAMNSTGTRVFVVGDYRYSRPSNFFYADQSKLPYFKKSDLVWAQAVRQTGAREVHFYFRHKVAKLDFYFDDTESIITPSTILTLEGMPDIDGAEIVVGDYYADKCYEDYSYNYRSKASCGYENNGRVIGIEVIDEARTASVVYGMTGNPSPAGGTYNSTTYGTVPNTGTYTAYHDPSNVKHYQLYVPACVLNDKATIRLRDGARRYVVPLEQTTFEEGVCYRLDVAMSDVLLDKTKWQAYASSVRTNSETGDTIHPAFYAIDNNPDTYWQSGWWSDYLPEYYIYAQPPHWLIVDMQKSEYLTAVTYLPRQLPGVPTGTVMSYEIYLSDTDTTSGSWTQAAAGNFDYAGDFCTEQTIPLSQTTRARYIKFVATKNYNDGSYSMMAEIGARAMKVHP